MATSKLELTGTWLELGAVMCYQRDSKYYSHVFGDTRLNGDEISHVWLTLLGRHARGGFEVGTTSN
jgi:hypothetical protein